MEYSFSYGGPNVKTDPSPLVQEPAPDVIGCILSGGQSRRMGGGDKTLKIIGGDGRNGVTMLDHICANFRPQVKRLILNANGDPARFGAAQFPITPDPEGVAAGPLAGVLAGLDWMATNAPRAHWLASIPGDTPFLPGDTVSQLANATRSAKHTIALARSEGGVHPVVALWHVSLRADLHAFLCSGENPKVFAFVNRHPHVAVSFPCQRIGNRDIDPFFNVNEPEDLRTAASIYAAMSQSRSAPPLTQAPIRRIPC